MITIGLFVVFGLLILWGLFVQGAQARADAAAATIARRIPWQKCPGGKCWLCVEGRRRDLIPWMPIIRSGFIEAPEHIQFVVEVGKKYGTEALFHYMMFRRPV